MPNRSLSHSAQPTRNTRSSAALQPVLCPHACGLECRGHPHFMTMLDTYRGTGGLAPAEEVLAVFARHRGPEMAQLGRWIDAREVLGFEWRREIWLPWFQFNRYDMVVHLPLRPVFAILNAVYDPWEMANWFTRGHMALRGRTPIDMLVSDLPAVRDAAKMDRLIANG